MKKRQMTIEEYKNPLGTHTITINNARYQKCFLNSIEKVLKQFLVDEELFFGFYRTDGVNLTLKRQKELKNEIPSLFQKYGDIQNLSEYLSIAKININDYIYNFIPAIFDYYLETTLFNPKVNWETFKQYHSNYQKHRFDDIILNNFTEVLFCYFDSGDFSICFNPEMHNPREVRNMIDEVFFEV
ncbi:MAG: hypothetical protein BWY46_01307 [Firmicutes bacterium ADurb.Bin300]|nr:MAG: hypothetical protein BWY46_01307 [Firmicutes bacterium ADurb.Bin300]